MRSIEFFETQFRRQVSEQEFVLNTFETLALDHLVGSVLDLGCGLGNLSLAAGRRGHEVVALDASPTAIERVTSAAALERLPIQAQRADIGTLRLDRTYDTIVTIGLLMFFRRERALELLRDVQEHVAPGGRAVVNVLIEGTTFMGMFEPGEYCLFGVHELAQRFAEWRILESRHETFAAPGETRKVFATIVAQRPE